MHPLEVLSAAISYAICIAPLIAIGAIAVLILLFVFLRKGFTFKISIPSFRFDDEDRYDGFSGVGKEKSPDGW